MPHTESMETELYNLSGTATKIGVTKKWLLNKVMAGKIPCLTIGKNRFLFNIEAVEAAVLKLASEESYNAH